MSILSVTYDDAVPPTLSDSVADPSGPYAGVYVGVGGTVVLQTIRNKQRTFVGCAAGSILPVACSRIWSTGTTAASLLGMLALPYKGAGGA